MINQKLIQIKKLLEIEDIIPMWVAKLTGRTGELFCSGIRSHSTCMVGEAHGGSDYTRTCAECNHHSGYSAHDVSMYDDVLMRYNNNIEELLSKDPLTLDELKSMPGVKAFVAHWNECHVTDTGPEPR